ncbi:MAG: hypothetical protein ACRD8W_26505, partial [Nitrososphaeraceae archaeon]
ILHALYKRFSQNVDAKSYQNEWQNHMSYASYPRSNYWAIYKIICYCTPHGGRVQSVKIDSLFKELLSFFGSICDSSSSTFSFLSSTFKLSVQSMQILMSLYWL